MRARVLPQVRVTELKAKLRLTAENVGVHEFIFAQSKAMACPRGQLSTAAIRIRLFSGLEEHALRRSGGVARRAVETIERVSAIRERAATLFLRYEG